MEAKFEFYSDGGGVTGTIDNFRLNDGSTNPGWSVALNRAGFGTTGAIGNPTTDTTGITHNTVWSINDNKAPASGAWSATLYDEGDHPSDKDDRSNVPTTAVGQFYSEFGQRRMVGGFGVESK